MNQKKAYEQTIAGKLEALPLPDLADAIWARIEKGLDTDMPAEDGGNNSPGAPSGGSRIGKGSLLVFLAAFITIFLISKNDKKQERILPSVPAQQPSPPPEKIILPTTSGGSAPHTAPPQRAGSAAAATTVTQRFDTITTAPTVRMELPPADTVQQVTIAPPPPPVKMDTIQPPKKKRGVSGLTDNDYRIVPGKKEGP